MPNNNIARSKIDRECMDCGCDINKGDEYCPTKSGGKNYIYCVSCKSKPEHKRQKYDYDSIYIALSSNPLFTHELVEYCKMNNTSQCNSLYRRMKNNGYSINKFNWQRRSYNRRVMGNKDSYKHGFQPNSFVIYYVEGRENLVIKRIIEEFDFKDVAWKSLLTALYVQKIPRELMTKEGIMYWANQNVFN